MNPVTAAGVVSLNLTVKINKKTTVLIQMEIQSEGCGSRKEMISSDFELKIIKGRKYNFIGKH